MDRRSVVVRRVRDLVDGLPRFVAAHEQTTPFNGQQLMAHRATVAMRRQAGSVRAAVEDSRIAASLRRTFVACGLAWAAVRSRQTEERLVVNEAPA